MRKKLVQIKETEDALATKTVLRYYLLREKRDSSARYGVEIAMDRSGQTTGRSAVSLSADHREVRKLIQCLAGGLVTPEGLQDTLFDLIDQWRISVLR